MPNYKDFLSSLTEEKYKEIIDKKINKDQNSIFRNFSPKCSEQSDEEELLKQYIHEVSLNSVIQILESYDQFLEEGL